MPKISGLPEDTSPTTDDFAISLDNGTTTTKKAKWLNIINLFKKNTQYQIGFRAHQNANFTTPGNSQTGGFAFDTIDYSYTNYGDGTAIGTGGYSTSTGLFTAPVNGVYDFKVQFNVENSNQRAFIVTRYSGTPTITAANPLRLTDIASPTAPGNGIARISGVMDIYLLAGQSIGFDIWTTVATNVAGIDTFVSGGLRFAA